MLEWGRFLKNLAADDRGTETVEWAVMAGLIVAAVVVTIGAISAWTQAQYSSLKVELGA